MVAMLSVSMSSCKEDGIDEDATILGSWVHEDGVGEADVLFFTGSLTQGEVTYTEYDDDDYPEVRKSSFYIRFQDRYPECTRILAVSRRKGYYLDPNEAQAEVLPRRRRRHHLLQER